MAEKKPGTISFHSVVTLCSPSPYQFRTLERPMEHFKEIRALQWKSGLYYPNIKKWVAQV